MIAYEELERALARWKARRSGTVEAEPSSSSLSGSGSSDADRTPPASVAGAPPSYHGRDGTNELELGDAEVDEE